MIITVERILEMKKSIKKGIAIATVIATMIVAPLNAQVFIQEDNGDLSPRNTSQEKEWIIVPVMGYDIDQYAATPLGSGVAILAGLAGAYALTKRKKK